MRATEILYSTLYGVEMKYGKVDIPKGNMFNCFVIVEHTSDKDYIESQAMELLLAGCREFLFYGEHCEIWHEIFKCMYVRLCADSTMEKYEGGIVTVSCKDIHELAERLFDTISCKTFIPCVNLLIYDDKLIYEQTCRDLEWLKQQNVLFHKVRIALKRMNPYSLLPDAPANEFYGVAERIAEQISETDSAKKIASVMARVLTESFGEELAMEDCIEYAKYISSEK